MTFAFRWVTELGRGKITMAEGGGHARTCGRSPSSSRAKHSHIRVWRKKAAQDEFTLAAIAQNLRRLATLTTLAPLPRDQGRVSRKAGTVRPSGWDQRRRYRRD
jgi:hypothetical protein